MRRVLGFLVVLLAGFLAGLLYLGVPAAVEGGSPPGGTRNGDTNGDGRIDVSDAVYLLLHLFSGGTEPVACADTPELVARVSDLEARVSEIETLPDTVLEIQGRADALESDVANLPGRTVFFGQSLCARLRIDPDCTASTCEYYYTFFAEPEIRESCAEPVTVGGGIIGEEILFETPSDGHLVIKLAGEGRLVHNMNHFIGVRIDTENTAQCNMPCRIPGSTMEVELDPTWYAPNIPSGPHTLTLFEYGRLEGRELLETQYLHDTALEIRFFPATP